MELILYTLRTVAYAIIEPTHILMLVILGIVFYTKNRRVSIMQKMTIGESLNSPLELTLSQIVLGIVAGTIGSIILSCLGIVFNQNSGIEMLFIVSLLLLFFKKRFICFSYSGAVLGIISIISSIIAKATGTNTYIHIDILSLMTFVGVLHIVEAFLVIIDGGRGALPVFSNRDGKIVGGFAFNRYWAIPIAFFIVISGSISSSATSISVATPNWWPIINKDITLELLKTAIISAIPLYGMIGYSSVTFTKDKAKKPIYSGLGILFYGISLTLVAQLANFGIIGAIIAIVYAPIAHEAMIKIQKKLEEKGEYLYVTDEKGVSILEVAPTSPAYEVGIRRGDKILEINNERIISEAEVFKMIRENIHEISIKIKKISGEIVDFSLKPRNKRIGILLVPKMVNKEDALDINKDDFKKVLDELKKKR
ncbi:S1C family serine protease [Clostridium carnis]